MTTPTPKEPEPLPPRVWLCAKLIGPVRDGASGVEAWNKPFGRATDEYLSLVEAEQLAARAREKGRAETWEAVTKYFKGEPDHIRWETDEIIDALVAIEARQRKAQASRKEKP